MILKYTGKCLDGVMPIKTTVLDQNGKETKGQVMKIVPGKPFEIDPARGSELLRKFSDKFEQVKEEKSKK